MNDTQPESQIHNGRDIGTGEIGVPQKGDDFPLSDHGRFVVSQEIDIIILQKAVNRDRDQG